MDIQCKICGTGDRRRTYHNCFYQNEQCLICNRCLREKDISVGGRGIFSCIKCDRHVIKGTDDYISLHGMGVECNDCFQEEYCEMCGNPTDTDPRLEYHPAPEGKHIVDKGEEIKLCGPCGDIHSFKCKSCGERYLKKNHEHGYRAKVCDDCKPYVPTCSACERLVGSPMDRHMITCAEEEQYMLCPSCLDRYIDVARVFQCYSCHNFFDTRFHDYESVESGSMGRGRMLCIPCSRNVNRCIMCDRIILDGNELCRRCRNNVIKNHYYQPDECIFHRCGDRDEDLYIGVELEMACPDCDRAVPAQKLLQEYSNGENLFYIKHDGSIGNGWEVVSHPCTLQYHKFEFPWKKICNRANDMNLRSHDTQTCGLHVHITNSLTYTQAIQFGAFVYNNKRLNEIIARRGGTDYSRYKKADKIMYGHELKDLPFSEDRYEAVNYVNNNTIELRIFRGTLNYNTLLACIEYAYAVYKFTQANSIQKCIEDKSRDYFLKYVQKNRKEFNYLYEYFKENGVI